MIPAPITANFHNPLREGLQFKKASTLSAAARPLAKATVLFESSRFLSVSVTVVLQVATAFVDIHDGLQSTMTKFRRA